VLDRDLLFSTETSDGMAVVHVSGDFDLSTVPSFEAELEPSVAAKLVVIDLAGCTFIDSSALRALVNARRRVAETGGTLGLVAPSQPARRVLQVAALDRFVPVWESVHEATTSTV
jgi:anti-sigma B factor antagonist